MARFEARSRGRWATLLLAGAVTQVVGIVALTGFADAAPDATPPTAMAKPADARAIARSKLLQARAQLSQGNFDTAQALAEEVKKQGLPFAAREDSAAKVLQDINLGRKDAKLLLTAARSSLARKEFDQGEKFAKEADKAGSLLTFPVWGDTPSAALKDIAQARKAAAVATKAAPKKDMSKAPAPKLADGRPVPKTPDAPEKSAKGGEEARALIAQARAALTTNKLDEAKKLTAMARAKKPNLSFWEDNPDRLDTDIRKAEIKSRPPAKIVPTSAKVVTKGPDLPGSNAKEKTTPRTKDEAKALLALGRRQLADGKIDEASQTTQRIKTATTMNWGLFEDSPDRLGIDIDKARVKRDRDESIELTAEGRKAYEKADYENATKLAYRAQKLHGPYSIWDLGDQPNKLLSEIHTAQAKARKAPLPPATVVRRETKGMTPAPTEVAKGAPPAPEVVPSAPKPAWTDVATNSMPPLPGTNAMPPIPGASVLPTPVPTAQAKPTPDKLKAMQLVAEAQRLQKDRKSLVAAQAKAMEAQKIGAAFTGDEVSPDAVYQQIAVDIRNQIEGLMRQSYDIVMYGQGDLAGRYRDAEAKLNQARQMAQASGQDIQPIDQRLADVRSLQAGKIPNRNAVVQTGTTAPTPAARPFEEEKLEQARNELKRGELGVARRLAEEVISGAGETRPAVRDQAASLLRTIDAEEGNQKRLATERAFEAAMAAYRRREFERSSATIASLDLRLLSVEQQGRLREISLTPEMAAGASVARKGPTPGIVQAAATVPTAGRPGALAMATATDLPGAPAAGRASATDRVDSGLLDRHKAMQRILLDKLRRDAIDIQRESADKSRSGQYDEAMERIQDFLGTLKMEQLDASQLASISRPLESRISSIKLMKAQSELTSGRMASRVIGQDRVNATRKAEEVKQKNVEKLMKESTEKLKAGQHTEAEGLASRVLEIDSDNTAASAMVAIARAQRNVAASKALKERKNDAVLTGLQDADDPGSMDAVRNGGLAYDPKRWDKVKGRMALSAIELGRSTKSEKEIERSMLTPINISFENTPLKTVLEELRDMYAINIVPDMPALNEAGVSMESPISMKLERVAMKSALNLILHQVKLTYIIKEDVLQITTQLHAQGKQKRVTYPVADLIVPANNAPASVPRRGQAGAVNPAFGATPYAGANSLPGGAPVGAGSSPGSTGSGTANSSSATASSGSNVTKTRLTNTQEEQLIQLITRSIRPETWDDMGGQATIQYHPMTLSLIVNQTTDIQEQIQDLLASLRRLQDQEVAVEVRFISVTEDFFERIGVKFDVNILTHNAGSQPSLLGNSFVTDSSRFINQFTPSNFLSGLTPAGTLTPGLDIPITNNSFLQAIPNFGGYASGGGLSLGLAFLSDIQVFLFMEAVQGDVRANVMQAPKLTMFNAQQATLSVQEDQYFVTQINLTNVPGTGQYAIVPNNELLSTSGVNLTITPVISADRRFVRLNLQPNLTNVVPSSLQTVAPIAVPIFTANDSNLGAGQPILVTQYVQQPAFTTVSVSTTVVVPDGGTVVMGGLKRLAESRNEFGPPVLSKIPYLNRLFKNVGYGRTTESLLIMVTPRIIIQEEEQTIQTGFSSAASAVGP